MPLRLNYSLFLASVPTENSLHSGRIRPMAGAATKHFDKPQQRARRVKTLLAPVHQFQSGQPLPSGRLGVELLRCPSSRSVPHLASTDSLEEELRIEQGNPLLDGCNRRPCPHRLIHHLPSIPIGARGFNYPIVQDGRMRGCLLPRPQQQHPAQKRDISARGPR